MLINGFHVFDWFSTVYETKMNKVNEVSNVWWSSGVRNVERNPAVSGSYLRDEGGDHFFERLLNQDVDFRVVLLLWGGFSTRQKKEKAVIYLFGRKLAVDKGKNDPPLPDTEHDYILHTHTQTGRRATHPSSRRWRGVKKPSHPCKAAELSS